MRASPGCASAHVPGGPEVPSSGFCLVEGTRWSAWLTRHPHRKGHGMTNKSDFTEQEWEVLREGPPIAGLMVATASGGGTFRESWALAKSFAEARQKHGQSELL